MKWQITFLLGVIMMTQLIQAPLLDNPNIPIVRPATTTSGGNSTYSNYTNYSTYKSPYGINEIGDYTFVGTEIASPNFQGRISDTNI